MLRALAAVTARTKQLQISPIIGSAGTKRNDVINVESFSDLHMTHRTPRLLRSQQFPDVAGGMRASSALLTGPIPRYDSLPRKRILFTPAFYARKNYLPFCDIFRRLSPANRSLVRGVPTPRRSLPGLSGSVSILLAPQERFIPIPFVPAPRPSLSALRILFPSCFLALNTRVIPRPTLRHVPHLARRTREICNVTPFYRFQTGHDMGQISNFSLSRHVPGT